jgi:hypothetical protein
MNIKITLSIFLSILINMGALAQTSAGIYKFKWRVDNRLVNNFIVNNAGGNDLRIPTLLYDSVMRRVNQLVSQEMQCSTRLLYPLNDKGKELQTASTSSQVGGLPRGSKRRAMRTEYLDFYVKFKIIAGVNKTMTIGGTTANYSRLKPYVKVKMRVYGIDKRIKRSKQSRQGGFNSIGSFEFNMGGTTVTNTNALPIEQVLDMIFKGLTRFESKI